LNRRGLRGQKRGEVKTDLALHNKPRYEPGRGKTWWFRRGFVFLVAVFYVTLR